MTNINNPTIIFEDNDILIIDKPAGIIVNKSDSAKNFYTIQDFLEEKFSLGLEVPTDGDFFKRAGIVHRLDKDTSGVMIVAKNEESFYALQKQFKAGKVEKVYIGLAHGKITPPEGEINVPIGRLPWNRMRFGILPQGRESKTLYKVLAYKKWEGEDFSYFEAYPKTGRTHQIRVHLRHIGNPLFADLLYGGRKTIRKDKKYLSRHFLHAHKIKFLHPSLHSEVEYISPLSQELSDFAKLLE